mmetsp:Transcript_121102/g.337295  ORF Transcript_121102/g.337295 Transcript_121102/m.337295 type:complete len:317 (+) Transcript_121102:363-1313(+)
MSMHRDGEGGDLVWEAPRAATEQGRPRAEACGRGLDEAPQALLPGSCIQSRAWRRQTADSCYDELGQRPRGLASEHTCSRRGRRADAAVEELRQDGRWRQGQGAVDRWDRRVPEHRQELGHQLYEAALRRGDRRPRRSDQGLAGGPARLQGHLDRQPRHRLRGRLGRPLRGPQERGHRGERPGSRGCRGRDAPQGAARGRAQVLRLEAGLQRRRRVPDPRGPGEGEAEAGRRPRPALRSEVRHRRLDHRQVQILRDAPQRLGRRGRGGGGDVPDIADDEQGVRHRRALQRRRREARRVGSAAGGRAGRCQHGRRRR